MFESIVNLVIENVGEVAGAVAILGGLIPLLRGWFLNVKRAELADKYGVPFGMIKSGAIVSGMFWVMLRDTIITALILLVLPMFSLVVTGHVASTMLGLSIYLSILFCMFAGGALLLMWHSVKKISPKFKQWTARINPDKARCGRNIFVVLIVLLGIALVFPLKYGCMIILNVTAATIIILPLVAYLISSISITVANEKTQKVILCDVAEEGGSSKTYALIGRHTEKAWILVPLTPNSGREWEYSYKEGEFQILQIKEEYQLSTIDEKSIKKKEL